MSKDLFFDTLSLLTINKLSIVEPIDFGIYAKTQLVYCSLTIHKQKNILFLAKEQNTVPIFLKSVQCFVLAPEQKFL